MTTHSRCVNPELRFSAGEVTARQVIIGAATSDPQRTPRSVVGIDGVAESQVETWRRRVRAAAPAALTRPRGLESLARLVRTRRRRARSRAVADPHCACRAVLLQSARRTLQAPMGQSGMRTSRYA